jgi:hypothetical protein
MKFVLFVEGHTEKQALANFLKRWLDPRLDSHIGFQVVRFDGWSDLVKETPKKARMYLNREDIIGVISLLDLYGPTIYPVDKTTAGSRYSWAKSDLEKRVNDQNYRQFFAVHETEAWLLSDPDIFPPAIRKALPGKTQHPETVNFDEPPSKLLQRLYKEKIKRTYKKVTHGKALFDRLDPAIAYKKCPYLRELFDEMLKLAREAGL